MMMKSNLLIDIDQFSNHSYQVNVDKCGRYYPKNDVIRIVKQMLQFIAQCHVYGVVHSVVQPRYLLY